MSKQKLFLIDGNSYCYRAYYAIKELRNSKGQPTNAVYGFILMLKKLLQDESPEYLAIAFDLKAPTFRHNKYEDYKAHRKPMPEDLVSQMPLIKEVIKGYNIPIFEKEGFEADDILATIAKNLAGSNVDIYIVTGDKDMLQLVSESIKVYSTNKEGLIYDINSVKERFLGLEPANIIDLIALSGDTSDNIPGVKGIGEKTAIELINKFKDIDNLYNNLDKIESKYKRQLLENGEDAARMSKELALLDASVPIQIDLEKMKIQEPDPKTLLPIFQAMDFKKLAKDIASDDSIVKREADYKTIYDKAGLDMFLKELLHEKEFVIDIESTSVIPLEAKAVGISFCWKEAEAYYLCLDSEAGGAVKSGIDIDYALKALKPILENRDIKKIGQNIKYDKLVLLNYGVELQGVSFDTMLASYLLNPSKISHNLDDLAFEHLGHKMIPIEDLIGSGKDKITMDKVPIEKISRYSCEDSDVTFRLKKIFEKELYSKELGGLFEKIEMPLIDVLAQIELNGVKIDVDLLKSTSLNMEEELLGLIKDIYNIAGSEFNINSPKQLSEVLFDKLKLPVIKKTKTGASTDMDVLQRLSQEHPLPKKLLRYRELSKLKSTYVDALPELVNKKTHRLHTSFNQTVTATGRLSSSNPNLQNIPVKTEEGRKIRKAFIGEKGNYILSADYSQIELRILAHISKDRELIQAFENNIDVHAHTASLVMGVQESEVTAEMRQRAKAVNFGIIYGISAFGLSKNLAIDPQSAQNFIDEYFQRYPKVKVYMEDKIEEARENGYVTTLFQRRRYIPEILNGAMREKQQAERIAINTPIQGSAADLIKIAMINIYEAMEEKKCLSKMILQVHDELVFEVPEDELPEMARLIRSKMENAVKLDVPIIVTVQYGLNWLEMEEI